MKSKNKNLATARDRALKRVEDIKGFYIHLAIYVAVGLIVLFTRANYLSINVFHNFLNDVEFLSWINWDEYGTPIIWGIALIFHALSVFAKNPFLGKAWEERQIQKYLAEDKLESEQYK